MCNILADARQHKTAPFHHQQPALTTCNSSLQQNYHFYFYTTMPNTDERRKEGGKVHALAYHVTHLSECNRKYGIHAKSKQVNGRVISVTSRPTDTGRTSTLVNAIYKLNGTETKEAELNIRSVREGWIDGPNFDATNESGATPTNEPPAPTTAPTAAQNGAQQPPNKKKPW